MTLNHPSSTELTISSYEDDDLTVLLLRGELDISSAPAFARAIADVCAHAPSELLLDVGGLGFVDSTGLRALLAAKALCEERSCRFAITEPLPPVQRLLEVAGVLDRLERRAASDGHLSRAVQLWPPPVRSGLDGHAGPTRHSTPRSAGRRP
jgi:anti-anti-sigma factor